MKTSTAERFRTRVDDLQGRIARRMRAMDALDEATGLHRADDRDAFMQLFFDTRDDVRELGAAVAEYSRGA